jgi:hypothetical protein
MFASRPVTRTLADGAAATGPLDSPSERTSGGGVIAAVHANGRGDERVHGGSADLDRWPPSLVELDIAQRCAADVDDLVAAAELYDVCGSRERATAIVLDVRHANRVVVSDEVLARAFGIGAQS